jgi:hypothetical protein
VKKGRKTRDEAVASINYRERTARKLTKLIRVSSCV